MEQTYKGFCAEISEHFRPSGNRDRGLQYLVQNPGNLCRCHPDRRASVNRKSAGIYKYVRLLFLFVKNGGTIYANIKRT